MNFFFPDGQIFYFLSNLLILVFSLEVMKVKDTSLLFVVLITISLPEYLVRTGKYIKTTGRNIYKNI